MRTVTFNVAGMHCASCPLLVDDCLLDVEGVRSARTDLRTGRSVVTAEDRVTDADLLAAIAEAGYEGVREAS